MTDELADPLPALLVLDAACRRWGADVQAIALHHVEYGLDPRIVAAVRLRPNAELVNVTIIAVDVEEGT
jgi:hypothetical protein